LMNDRTFHQEKRNKCHNSRYQSNQTNERPTVRIRRLAKNHPSRTLQNGRSRGVLNANDGLVLGVVAEISCFNPNGVRTSGKQLNTRPKRGMQGVQFLNIRLEPDSVGIQGCISLWAVGGHEQVSGKPDCNRHEGCGHEMRHLHRLE